jgi:hypothetical protein
MKFSLALLLGSLLGISLIQHPTANFQGGSPAKKTLEVISLGLFEGTRPIEIIIPVNNEVSLQIISPETVRGFNVEQKQLDYLKKIVEDSTGKNGVLLKSGFTLKTQGYPVWEPYGSLSHTGNAQALHFGRKVSFVGSTLVVQGTETKPTDKYPYNLTK